MPSVRGSRARGALCPADVAADRLRSAFARLNHRLLERPFAYAKPERNPIMSVLFVLDTMAQWAPAALPGAAFAGSTVTLLALLFGRPRRRGFGLVGAAR